MENANQQKIIMQTETSSFIITFRTNFFILWKFYHFKIFQILDN